MTPFWFKMWRTFLLWGAIAGAGNYARVMDNFKDMPFRFHVAAFIFFSLPPLGLLVLGEFVSPSPPK